MQVPPETECIDQVIDDKWMDVRRDSVCVKVTENAVTPAQAAAINVGDSVTWTATRGQYEVALLSNDNLTASIVIGNETAPPGFEVTEQDGYQLATVPVYQLYRPVDAPDVWCAGETSLLSASHFATQAADRVSSFIEQHILRN